MKTKNIIPITLLSLLALAACDTEDSGSSTLPPPVPATISTATIANDGGTRATGADGYDGPVKTQFVNGDIIVLTHYHGKKPVTTTVIYGEVGSSTLLVNADTARIVATYLHDELPQTDADGITTYPDKLQAGEAPGPGFPAGTGATVDYTTDPATIALTFEHTQTLLEIGTVSEALNPSSSLTLKDGEPVYISITHEGSDKKLKFTGEAPEPGSPAELAAIAPPGATINTVTFTLANGMQFTAIPHGEPGTGTLPALAAGTRHPINITVSGQTATITPPAEGEITPWGTEETAYPVPEGYDRAIYTEADLEAFHEATNNWQDPATQATACAEKVIQMADITLTKIWDRPIAGWSTPFTGKYNGNGYTISGLKVNTSGYAALFQFVDDGATLTNIHLRDVEITGGEAAALAIHAKNKTTISLCSATGSVTGTIHAGGLVINLYSGSTLLRSRATCTVTANGGNTRYAGGLVGYNEESTILGCMAGGSVGGTATTKGGLVGHNASTGTIYHSYTTTAGIDLVGNNGGTIGSSYDATTVYNAAGAPSATNAPGPTVRSGEHEAAGKTYVGTEIWTSGDYPTLRYTYEGIQKQ